ncbi:hypothetical protein Ctob_002766 [Chrysochromulina tobinii]|uniref:Uncharacterized protein n=1 Tax=Chrysochromulina tobinii TaxID=1460289 RepID=A0A0M0JD69_9EUKA|nr:hypothetical protein Ctob_002766 [Chrysochromulina tobinii]|eukprot:KOO24511.1 hypothetical protein Ctob_002766 [Chrysochromulina sp. CCMP291]
MMAASVNRRATVHLGKRARYEGRVHDEERHGLGTLFIDEGDGEESALRVTWRHDVPHGVGSLVEPDGGRVSGHWYDGSREALTRDPYEARRVCVRASERILDGLTDVGDGLFAIRELRPGEVVAFFGGGVRLGPSTLEACQEADECAAEDRDANNSTLEHEACEEADECDAEDRDANDSDGDAECERGADKGCGDDAVVDSVDAAHVAAARAEPDWGTVAADGTFIWLPEAWRDCSSYVASLGHKANHAGWRANCELVPFEHPRLGQCSALRVLSGGGGGGGGVGEGVAEGTELTVCYAHLVTLPAGSRPAWLSRLLELRAEEGYYAHLAFTPPRTLLRCRSSIAANGRLRVVSHGPWRVLWFDGVEQGMTYHEPDGRLLPAVVGFDYQRTMVPHVPVILSDAASHVHGLAAGTLDCVLLDAYDAKGRVPTHLQAVPFVRALGTALAPGGCVIANLWHGTADARAAAHGFAQLLDRDAGLRSWALPVVGHEKNCILIALRPKDGRSIATSKAELRRRLLHAAAAYAAAPEMEPAMLKTMRANADTIEAWAVG